MSQDTQAAEQKCRFCGEEIRQDVRGWWMDRETHTYCDTEGQARRHAPKDQSEYDKIVTAVIAVVREADQLFEKVGGSSRHWVRDCFLPLLNKANLVVVSAPDPSEPEVIPSTKPSPLRAHYNDPKWLAEYYLGLSRECAALAGAPSADAQALTALRDEMRQEEADYKRLASENAAYGGNLYVRYLAKYELSKRYADRLTALLEHMT